MTAAEAAPRPARLGEGARTAASRADVLHRGRGGLRRRAALPRDRGAAGPRARTLRGDGGARGRGGCRLPPALPPGRSSSGLSPPWVPGLVMQDGEGSIARARKHPRWPYRVSRGATSPLPRAPSGAPRRPRSRSSPFPTC